MNVYNKRNAPQLDHTLVSGIKWLLEQVYEYSSVILRVTKA